MQDYNVILVDPTEDEARVREISELLSETAEDLKESHGGHVPDQIVDRIVQTHYTTTHSIRHSFHESGFRFCLTDATGHVAATALVARVPDRLLVLDSDRFNVSFEPGTYAPGGLHHIFNIAVRKTVRRIGLARRLLSSLSSQYRHLFLGHGLLMRAEPPDHPIFERLGFRHLPRYDVFFPAGVDLPTGLSSPAEYNAQFACRCDPANIKTVDMMMRKLKYAVFTKDL